MYNLPKWLNTEVAALENAGKDNCDYSKFCRSKAEVIRSVLEDQSLAENAAEKFSQLYRLPESEKTQEIQGSISGWATILFFTIKGN